jgi:alpha-1,6-mannosyltransferase
MITLDINSNYCDRGGGIRTYHQAKIAWSDRQRGHRYYLVVPGPRPAVRRIGRRVVRIEVYGIPLGSGYRLLIGYPRVAGILRRLQPDVVEVGDPVLSGLFCLLLRWLGRLHCHLSAFYHSDLIETWVVPWAARGRLRGCRRWLAATLGKLFYRLQRGYDTTIVASRTIEKHLNSKGVSRVERFPLGVDQLFFGSAQDSAAIRSHKSLGGDPQIVEPVILSINHATPKRLLFVGRLLSEKAADVLWKALPEILQLPGVEVSVLGSGPAHQRFSSAHWPGYHYLGYVSNRRQLAEVYRQHDILLAPGPYETFGLAVLEAMACGLVVVGPDRGGTAELLAEANSPFVFRAGDVADFVRVVSKAAGADLVPHRRLAQGVARRYGTADEAIGRLMTFYLAQLSERRLLTGPWLTTDVAAENKTATKTAAPSRRRAA